MYVCLHFTCRHTLGFVYESLLQNALDDFKQRWNTHRIRPNRTAGCPPGVPDDLYFLPNLSGMTMHSITNIILVISGNSQVYFLILCRCTKLQKQHRP